MMNLGKEVKRFFSLAVLVIVASGCRIYGIDSMNSSSAPNKKSPNQGDPYTWGGIQEGTGGQVAATQMTMESADYSGPKFKQIAGTEGFTSMSGHTVAPAKPNDNPGDWQPLPSENHAKGGGEDHKEEGH